MSQATMRANSLHLTRSKSGPTTAPGRIPVPQATSRSASRRPALETAATSPLSATLPPVGDFTSPQATAALIRRVLCPSSATTGLSSPVPWQEQLPSLTSRVDIDEQLYALIAVVLKEFVHTWYGKLTPDHRFADEAVRIIAHCTRQLEARASTVDWVEILADQIPALINRHVQNFTVSRASSIQSSFVVHARAYHALNPHPAFDPPPDGEDLAIHERQERNEHAYHQILVQEVLAVLLPKDDLQNPTLRILVTDIIADLILGKALSNRLCESWMIWDSVSKAVLAAKNRLDARGPSTIHDPVSESVDEVPKVGQGSLLEKSGLLELVSDAAGARSAAATEGSGMKLPTTILRMFATLNYLYIGLTLALSLGRSIYWASSLPSRRSAPEKIRARYYVASGKMAAASSPAQLSSETNDQAHNVQVSAMQDSGPVDSDPDARFNVDVPISSAVEAPELANGSGRHTMNHGGLTGAQKKPILLYSLFALVNKMSSLSQRLPWLVGGLEMARHHLLLGFGRFGDTDGALDKYIHREMEQRLDPSLISSALISLRVALFPNNILAPARATPSPGEQLAIRRQAAETILSCIPRSLATRYFGGVVDQRKDVDTVHKLSEQHASPEVVGIEEILDVFGIAYCNKHVALEIVELLLVCLVPEIAERPAGEILEDALSSRLN